MMKRHPAIARSRNEMAHIYRRMRRERPEMARLLYRRIKACTARLNEKIWQ